MDILGTMLKDLRLLPTLGLFGNLVRRYIISHLNELLSSRFILLEVALGRLSWPGHFSIVLLIYSLEMVAHGDSTGLVQMVLDDASM